ncbi:MAG: DNA-binding protein [Candidatus Bathyarchaeota archaeon]|nr:MAG: DNA-binding protein [Candidatus Bathyarchaeota archaeon]
MKSIESETKRVIFARFFENEELLETIAEVARRNNINSGFFFLIGTLKEVVLGYYKDGKYLAIEKPGPLEIASGLGNISIKDGSELVVHGHVVVSDLEGNAFGGHVLPGCLVDATVEFVLVEVERGILKRKLDARRNLFLWSIVR